MRLKLGFIISVLFLGACHPKAPDAEPVPADERNLSWEEEQIISAQHLDSIDAAMGRRAVPFAELNVDTITILAMTHQWAQLLGRERLDSLVFLYADSVYYDGEQKSKADVISSKAWWTGNNDSYSWLVDSASVALSKIDARHYKTTFGLTIGVPDRSVQTTAYLMFGKTNNRWKITVEGSAAIDSNIAYYAREKAADAAQPAKPLPSQHLQK